MYKKKRKRKEKKKKNEKLQKRNDRREVSVETSEVYRGDDAETESKVVLSSCC